uniref:Peroxin-19 n=1 Tax=Percolomonas cosmopolitus TaxID=63605 RepID=A0A7S1KTC6_9EUKA|mmetsp:Transcript_8875/g.32764  ORF Transcript_8875/g.32764 Transcript_8875/m.32764 type:complete len:355 (+) Transcript_8875:3-1067(+)
MSSSYDHDPDLDPELNDILNDALIDFDTLSTTTNTQQPNTQQQQQQQSGTSSQHKLGDQSSTDEQQREPSLEEQAELEELTRKMKEMLSGLDMDHGTSADANVDLSEEDLFKNFSDEEKKMFTTISQQMGKLFNDDMKTHENSQEGEELPAGGEQQKDLDDMINETLSMLNKEPESWSQDENRFRSTETNSGAEEANPDELLKDMLKMFSGGASSNGEGVEGKSSDEPVDEDKMYGILENMMQTLMSPDILHEPMQKLVEQYPKWLDEKKGTADPELYEKVEQQYKYAKQICDVYDNKSFPGCLEEVMELMKEMQECGQPPEEIVQAITDEGGEMPQFPSMPDASSLGKQCPVQ